MIDKKTITAVVFVYNEEKYINDCLRSLLNQTIQVDKIIVVDDFSTDNTYNILKSYKQVDLVRSLKKGMAYACETGLKLVDTDLFFICDGDDIIMNKYVENMYKFIQSESIKYAYSNYIITDDKLIPKGFVNKKKYYTKHEMIHKCYTAGYLFGYSEIIDYLIPFPNNLPFHDWYISIVLSQQFGQNYINNTPLFKYRRHMGSDSFNLDENRQKYLKSLEKHLNTLKVIKDTLSEITTNRIIESRIRFFDAMISQKLSKIIKVLISDHYTCRDKISVSFSPLTFRFKYKA